MNRASQRETLSYKTYDTLNKKSEEVKEPFIEAYGTNRDLIPNETFVIIGYYKSQEQLEWIVKNNLYNFRTGTNLGSLPLGRKEVSAKYLVLHGKGETKTSRIFKLIELGPKVFSNADLLKKEYPNPTGEIYLVYTIDRSAEEDFNSQKWDLNKLANFTSHRASAKPFSVTLGELLNAKESSVK